MQTSGAAGSGAGEAAAVRRPGRVLTVCTGNICRSPLLERVLQRELDQRWGKGAYEVTSAGTHGLEGKAMDERAAAVLRTFGGSPHGFIARRLRPRMLADVDLVLTATLTHRARVVGAHPAVLRRAFTFREFAALAESVTDQELSTATAPKELGTAMVPQEGTAVDHAVRLRTLARLLASRRGVVPVTDPDIVDPFRQDDAVYEAMTEQVREALPAVLRVLL